MGMEVTRRGLLRQTGSTTMAVAAIGAATKSASGTNDGGSHPMFQYDAANTGHNPTSSGPTDSVKQKWAFDVGEPIRSSPAVASNTIYFGHSSGMAFALDAETGEQRWSLRTGAVETGLAVDGNRVYLTAITEPPKTPADDNGAMKSLHLRSLFGTNGLEIWNVALGNESDNSMGRDPGSVDTSPVIVRNAVFTGGTTPRLINKERGDIQQKLPDPTSYGLEVAGNLAADGKSVYASWEDPDGTPTFLLAFDFGSREMKWTKEGAGTRIPLTIAESTIFGATGDVLFARSASDGSKKWEFRTGIVKASPAVANGTIYVGSTENRLYALSVASGELEWLVPTDAAVQSAPSIADGVVYFGTDAGTIYAVDAENGEQLWTFETGGKVQSSPAVVGGTLYVGSDDKKLYALTE